MARDFRAKQVRTSVIIGSGSIESSRPHLGLVFYSASKASDFNGVRTTGGTVLSTATQLNLSKDAVSKQFGDDVWCLFDGQSAGGTYPSTSDRADGSTVLFLGDVVVSGSLFAERQSIEVDTTTVGNFYTPDTSEAKFAGGFGSTGATITNAGNISTNGFVQSNEFKNHANANLAVKTTGGGEIHFDSHTGIFKFMDAADTDDIFAITVAGGTGATTLSTTGTGGDGVSADITVDADGAIILDAADTGAEAVKIEAPAGSIKIGTTLADAKTLTLGNTNSTYISLEPHGTAGSEKILIKNTAGDTDSTSTDGAIRLEAAAGGITLDAQKNIRLDANGGQVKITDNGSSQFLFNCDGTEFIIYDDDDTGDQFKITVAEHGETTIATIDDDAAAGHLKLDVDGHIDLDPAGDIIFSINGTHQGWWELADVAADVWWEDADGVKLFGMVGTTAGGDASSLRMHTAKKLEFHDASQYIYAPSDNNLSGVAPHSITLNAGAAGSTLGAGAADSGAVLVGHSGIHIGGTGTGTGIASIAANSSPMRIFKATADLKPANVSQTGQANYPFNGTSGDTVASAGDLVISNRTTVNGTTGKAEGNIIFDGAVNMGTINTDGNVIIGGDLTVNGAVTTLDTTNLLVKDPFIILAKDQSGSPGLDAGFLVERGDSPNVAFIWDETNGAVFRAITTNSAATTSGNVVHTGHAVIAAQQFYLESSSNKIDLDTDVVITAAADVTFTVAGGNVTPTANDGAALGSADKNWSDLFLADGGILKLGDDQDVTLTHVPDAGLLLNSTRQLQFGDSGTYINQSADSKLAVVADGAIHLSAPSVGVGTTAPNEPLHVREEITTGGSNSVLKLHSYITNGFADGDGPGIKFSGGDSGAADNTIGRIACMRDGADTEGKLGFFAGTNGAEEFMTVKSSGKVGIGVNDPDYKLEVMSTDTYQQKWSRDSNSFATMRVVQFSHTTLATGESGDITLDAAGDIILDADGDQVSIKFGGATGQIDFTQANSGDGIIQQKIDTKDLVVQQFDGNEVVRFTDDRKLKFFDDGDESIHGDGDDLIISSGRHVTLAGASAQLNFNNSNSRIYVDSGELKFRDTENTDPVSLENLLEVSPANGALLSVGNSGAKRSKSTGGMVISSRDKYMTDTNIFANSTPNPSDLFFYVGDDAGTRLNSAFKNNVAVSGSISMVDTSDALSSTKFTQTSDNFILSMNTSTATTPGSFHNILTIEPAAGLKLGTTAGSGNAGLYFQDTDLNLQKVTHTVEGNASQKCIQIKGHLLPQTDNSFNLGTADRRFANLYTGDLHLNNMGSSNDVDGTAGNWTIQEGEDNLYVINNLTGKKFKMMLQPLGDEE